LSIVSSKITAILHLTLYMDFRGKFMVFFLHLVLNGELLQKLYKKNEMQQVRPFLSSCNRPLMDLYVFVRFSGSVSGRLAGCYRLFCRGLVYTGLAFRHGGAGPNNRSGQWLTLFMRCSFKFSACPLLFNMYRPLVCRASGLPAWSFTPGGGRGLYGRRRMPGCQAQ
jgi:hypothetical protein